MLETESLDVGSGETKLRLWLTRCAPKVAGAPAVLLLHGGNTTSHIFLVPEGGLAGYLHDQGFDVWLLDWRASPRVADPLILERPPLGGSVAAEREAYTIDRVVSEDIPAALGRIRERIGADASLAIVGFCIGAGSAAVAIARGAVEPFRVGKVVLLTLGLFYEVPWNGWLKAEDFLLERVLHNAPWCRGIDPLERTPWPDDMAAAYRRWPRGWKPGGATAADEMLRRLAFMMGQPFAMQRLHPSLQNDGIRAYFGNLPLGLYLHTSQMVRRGFAAPFDRPDTIERARLFTAALMPPPPLDDLRPEFFLRKDVTLVAAAQDRLWHRDSIDLMFEWLRSNRCVRSAKVVVPGANIMELLWGANAHADSVSRDRARARHASLNRRTGNVAESSAAIELAPTGGQRRAPREETHAATPIARDVTVPQRPLATSHCREAPACSRSKPRGMRHSSLLQPLRRRARRLLGRGSRPRRPPPSREVLLPCDFDLSPLLAATLSALACSSPAPDSSRADAPADVVASTSAALSTAKHPLATPPVPTATDAFVGDFNGNGSADLVTWLGAPANVWNMDLSVKPYGFNFTPEVWHGDWGSDGPIQVGDLNGDGKSDVFMWRGTDLWSVNLSNPKGTDFVAAEWTGMWGSDGPNFVGDLDGDGTSDVFMWRAASNNWSVNLSQKSSFTGTSWAGSPGIPGATFIGDLNKDGKTDVFSWDQATTRWDVNISSGSGFKPAVWGGAWGSDGPINVGDLNGDGRTDVFMWRASNNDWTVNLSNDTGTNFNASIWNGGWGSDGPINVGDLNGDGLTDVFMYSAARGNWTVNLSTGTGFTMEGWTGNPGNGTIHVADVNGDHFDDVLIHNPDGSWAVNISLGNNWSPEPFEVPSQIVATESGTLSGHMWMWAPGGHDGNEQFSYPVQFTDYSPGGWTMSIAPQTITGIEDITISASGPITGDNATLTVPVTGAETAVMTLSTTFTIDPGNGGGPVSGVPYSGPNNLMQFVGQDPTGKYKAMVQGTITAWP